MSRARHLSERLVNLARLLMPQRHGDWARAMAAEQAHIADHRNALAFSAGCLRAAGWERLRSLAPEANCVWTAAVTTALLLLSASVPGSRSWPLVWAPLGGLVAVMTLEQIGGRMSFGRVVRAAFQTGLLCAVLFVAGLLMLVTRDGAPLPERLALFFFIGSLVAFLTTISGAALAPLVCSPPRGGVSHPERSIEMAIARHPSLTAGIALGILYLFEGLFATGILFAVWPILGGVFAAALIKWNQATGLTPGSGAKAGAKAGLIGGAIVVIVGTPLIYFLLQKVDQAPKFFGIQFDMGLLPTLLAITGIYALVGMLVAAAAGGLTGLLAGKREGARHG